jgi:hypothetical protein
MGSQTRSSRAGISARTTLVGARVSKAVLVLKYLLVGSCGVQPESRRLCYYDLGCSQDWGNHLVRDFFDTRARVQGR